jgi:hypothetical protein
MRTQLINLTRNTENAIDLEKIEDKPITSEKDLGEIRVLHTSMQPFYQENPKMRELEERVTKSNSKY